VGITPFGVTRDTPRARFVGFRWVSRGCLRKGRSAAHRCSSCWATLFAGCPISSIWQRSWPVH